MAGDSILQFFSDLLLRVIPSPEIWGFILFATFAGYMILRKFPMSAGGYVVMILVIGLSSMVGGNFGIIQSMLWAVSGATFFLALWNFIRR